MNEVYLAADHHVWILPIRVEDEPPDNFFRYRLGRKQWFDALEPPIERHLEKIRAEVEKVLVESHQEPFIKNAQ